MTTFDPTTTTLGAERDRLADRAADLDEKLEETEAGSEKAARYRREANDVEQEGQAVHWLIEGADDFAGYGADAEVTIQGLRAGAFAEVENRSADAQSKSTGEGGVPGTASLIFAASGLVDAPFLGDGHPNIDETLDPSSFDDRMQALAELPVGVRKWLEDRITAEMEVGAGNWRAAAETTSD